MKAAFYEGNGSIQIGDCVPQNPGVGEVQINVSYAGICGTDLHIYLGHMDNRVKFPQIMGHEVSGTVSAVGKEVSNFTIGDRVTVMPLIPCGECPACKNGHSHICHNLKFMGIETSGAFQSYWTVPAYTVLPIPESLSMKHGALLEPLAVACHDARMGEVKKDDYVVVLGGGPIGTLIALVSKELGAKVLVSEINPYRLTLLKELGIDVINPTESNIVEFVNRQTDGAGADVIFEVTSSSVGAETMTQLACTRGRIVVVAIFNHKPQVDLHRFFWRELRLLGARVYERTDFEKAIQLADSGVLPLDKVITSIYQLDDLEKGLKQMKEGDKVMKVLVDCSKQ